jgi:putative DNA primase/helicase
MSNTASTIKPAGPTLARALKRQPFRVIDGHSAHDYDEASTLVVKPPGDVRFEPPGDPGESLGEAAYMVPEATDDPHRLARAVLARYTHSDGLTLAHYRGEFYVYDGTAYRLEPEFTSRALVKLVKEAVDIQHRNGLKASRSRVGVDAQKGASDGRHRPKTVPKVSKRLIGDVAQALESMVPIDSYQEAPFWRFPRPGDPDPINLLAARNGLVDLSNDRPVLWPHTPRFFSTHVLPFGYDPAARPPETWIRFLNDQWGDDPESIESLHEVMGYLLTPGTRQHKMFLLIGPPRSVRSTMKEIITALIGERNVAPTSAIALAGAFGLEPLLGKTVAVMADARTGVTRQP